MPGPSDRGPLPARRGRRRVAQRARSRANPQPKDRLRLSKLQSAFAHQRARERRAAALLLGRPGQGRDPRLRGPCAARTCGPRAQPSQSALRRPAAAGRDRARADQQPGHPDGRRADRKPRFADLARNHGHAAEAQPRPGTDDRAGDPRRGARRVRRSSRDAARRSDHFGQAADAAPGDPGRGGRFADARIRGCSRPGRAAATLQLRAGADAAAGAARVLGIRRGAADVRDDGAARGSPRACAATSCARSSRCSEFSSASPR